MLAWHSSLIDRLSLVVRGSRSVVYGEVPSKWSVGTTTPSLQSHSGQQPSQRPDLRGNSSYEHGVVPLPVLFTLEALTMTVTRYSTTGPGLTMANQDGRTSEMNSGISSFIQILDDVSEKVGGQRTMQSCPASSGTFPPHRPNRS